MIVVIYTTAERKLYSVDDVATVGTGARTDNLSTHDTTVIGWAASGILRRGQHAEHHWGTGAPDAAAVTAMFAAFTGGTFVPETDMPGWVDGITLETYNPAGTYTSVGGKTFTASVFGGGSVSAGAAAHPVTRVAAPTFTGAIPTLTGTQGAALAVQSPTIASYFTGTGITYTVSTALPSGISINSSTGVISGTPATDTDWSGTVTATNGGGAISSNTFAITISLASSPVAFTGTVPAQSGTVGSAYGTLSLAGYFSGSLTPYTYSVFSGALPGGLSLNTSTGQITGTPTTAGSFSAVVRATDTGSNTANTGTIAWTIAAAVATTVSITLTTDGTTPAASLTGLKWAFWDEVTPDLFAAAPVAKGAAETTDASGVFSASITGTALTVGATGYLIVTNSDGTTTQGAALKGYVGPVTVS